MTMLACCGLDCAECPAHKVFIQDDPELRKQTAAEWSEQFHVSFDPEKLFCTGCHATEYPHSGYCALCPVRSCATSKNMENCGVCGEYTSCEIISDFLATVPELKPKLDQMAADSFKR